MGNPSGPMSPIVRKVTLQWCFGSAILLTKESSSLSYCKRCTCILNTCDGLRCGLLSAPLSTVVFWLTSLLGRFLKPCAFVRRARRGDEDFFRREISFYDYFLSIWLKIHVWAAFQSSFKTSRETVLKFCLLMFLLLRCRDHLLRPMVIATILQVTGSETRVGNNSQVTLERGFKLYLFAAPNSLLGSAAGFIRTRKRIKRQ